jgi:type IV pilus assembly protein PilA
MGLPHAKSLHKDAAGGMRAVAWKDGTPNMVKKQEGFTLIELLVVVAIILVIAAIAIPNLLHSRIAANEASAVNALRTINTSANTYFSTYGDGYPPSLGAMGGPAGAATATCDQALMLDSVLSNGGTGNTSSKSGYKITYVPGTSIGSPAPGCSAAGVYNFQATAIPVTEGMTGQRGFYVDASGVIRFTTDGTAPTQSSQPLQ